MVCAQGHGWRHTWQLGASEVRPHFTDLYIGVLALAFIGKMVSLPQAPDRNQSYTEQKKAPPKPKPRSATPVLQEPLEDYEGHRAVPMTGMGLPTFSCFSGGALASGLG